MLIFLKKSKWPRSAPDMDEKSVGEDESDRLEEHCCGELMDAAMSKDVSKFRSALQALVMNLFETGDSG